MIEKETPSKLMSEKEKIKEICARKGFVNLRLTASGMTEDENTLQFIVDSVGKSDMFDKVRTSQKISELIGCKIKILTESEIPKFLKSNMLSTAVSIDNESDIRKFFEDRLFVPESQIKEQSPDSVSDMKISFL